jgi:hypothetical protein
MTEETQGWRIREADADWDCDWSGAERFHIRCFKALPMQEKLEAVEEMCRFVEMFRGCALRPIAPDHHPMRRTNGDAAAER